MKSGGLSSIPSKGMDMDKEQKIVDNLINKFDFLKDSCQIIRIRRITIQVPAEHFINVLEFVKNSLDFDQLCTITGLDCYEFFQAIYQVANKDGILMSIKLDIPKNNPVIKTVFEIYNGSLFYERELKDLLGIQVEGLPAGRRYPLPDSWPEDQFPLRKDWKMSSKTDGGK
jgi:membrane-bound hydrogenase subunit beta